MTSGIDTINQSTTSIVSVILSQSHPQISSVSPPQHPLLSPFGPRPKPVCPRFELSHTLTHTAISPLLPPSLLSNARPSNNRDTNDRAIFDSQHTEHEIFLSNLSVESYDLPNLFGFLVSVALLTLVSAISQANPSSSQHASSNDPCAPSRLRGAERTASTLLLIPRL